MVGVGEGGGGGSLIIVGNGILGDKAMFCPRDD